MFYFACFFPPILLLLGHRGVCSLLTKVVLEQIAIATEG